MPSFPARLRAACPARAAALALAALAAGACGNNDIGEDEDEPTISAVRLTITPPGGGAPTQTVVRAGTTVSLRVGTSTVAAVPLDANNQSLTLDEPFELRLVASVSGAGASEQQPLSGVFSFVGTPGALAGTITASTTATGAAVVRLIHVEEAHTDFDAAVTLTAAP